MIALDIGIQPLNLKRERHRRLPLYGSRFSPVPGGSASARQTDAMALADNPMGAGSTMKVR